MINIQQTKLTLPEISENENDDSKSTNKKNL